MPVTSASSYLSQILPALNDTAGRFAALIEGAPDTAAQVPACPGWTVRDVAAHVADTAVHYGRRAGRRGPSQRT